MPETRSGYGLSGQVSLFLLLGWVEMAPATMASGQDFQRAYDCESVAASTIGWDWGATLSGTETPTVST
jgi:hypothetical protein